MLVGLDFELKFINQVLQAVQILFVLLCLLNEFKNFTFAHWSKNILPFAELLSQ